MLIYVSSITNRLRFTFDFVFGQILRIPFEITTNHTTFLNYPYARLNYSQNRIGNELFIQAHSLLFETGIRKQEIIVSEWHKNKIFFQAGKSSFIPFDIFAATFYLITRYEEYLPYTPDFMGRYQSGNSISLNKNFLQSPVVDEWIFLMAEEIKKTYPAFTLPARQFNFIPTIDVDHSCAYRFKGPLRTIAMMFSLFCKLQLKEIFKRLQVITAHKNDPYDTFEIIEKLHTAYNVKPIFFFQVGKYGKYDKNISICKPWFRQLIKAHSILTKVGIHPSVQSNKKFEILLQEVKNLNMVTGLPVLLSRQHYLKLIFPETYRRLIKAGIKEDYSMGYSDIPGFRAGTCTPFYFFDLLTDKPTELKIFPFSVMDSMYRYHLNYTTEQAWNNIKEIIDKIKAVNGTFISVWHNDNFSFRNKQLDLLALYEIMLKYLKTINQ